MTSEKLGQSYFRKERIPQPIRQDIKRFAEISKWLRKEREFSFYGDIDLIPTEEYTQEDAIRARDDAEFVVNRLKPAFDDRTSRDSSS